MPLCAAAFYLGGRWPYMWLGSLIHGLVIENISMNIPDIENYWQSQTTIIFLGRKMPLHIMILCEFRDGSRPENDVVMSSGSVRTNTYIHRS